MVPVTVLLHWFGHTLGRGVFSTIDHLALVCNLTEILGLNKIANRATSQMIETLDLNTSCMIYPT